MGRRCTTKPWGFCDSMLNIPSHGKLGSDDMVSRLSDKEDDPRDKLMPSVSYLQKLGPEHLQQIFNSSRWIFELNGDIAFEVFFFLMKFL
jgi:hypothetical protein